ncbi:MAG: TonB-dependent receptor [Steroidobacteraceae bacterium]
MNRSLCSTFGLIVLGATCAGAHAEADSEPGAKQPAQDSTLSDQTVIVTGTRSVKAVDKIPGAITVVTPAEVKRELSLTEDATAILSRSVPGYSESSQALNTIGETLRGRVPLRLFDGIPQSTPLRDGSRNGTFTDMDTVSRVEVINGPSAAEGIGAAGGIINYISKQATEPGTQVGITSRIGSQFKGDSDIWKVGVNLTHKQDAFDLVFAGAFVDRGITYDADGRRIGLSASSSVADSQQKNAFLKVGTDFGADNQQRLQFSGSWFKLSSKGNYHWVEGSRALRIADTSEPGPPLGTGGVSIAGTEFNEFQQYVLTYHHDALFGGSFAADVYYARQAMRFPGDNSIDRQDPLIAPIGELVDMSEILSRKKGIRTSWTRPDVFGLTGLELHIGVDAVQDDTQQRLALTDRIWVPPMDYKSLGPYAQLSYDIGPVTLSGGLRHEDGKVTVDDYTTTWYRNREFVQGGALKYKDNLRNGGIIWRINHEWSVFGSYSEGFTLPNIGIPLRNINTPGRSVEGLFDLKAIVFDNKEAGFNWRADRASLGASYYESKSDLGSSLSVDPITKDYVLNRAPVKINGVDFTGDYRLTPDWKVTVLYAHVKGKTTSPGNPGGPLNLTLGVSNISPDKLSGSLEWRFLANGTAVFGATSYLGRDINEGTSAAEHTHGYTLYDLSMNYDAGKLGAFSLGIENLTNKFYFLSSSQVDLYRNYFAGRGRLASLTYRYEF